MGKMKSGKAARPSEVSLEMITASGVVGIHVMMELYQQVLDGRGMPEDWKMSLVKPIFKGKGDVMSCGAYRGVKLLEHAVKIVESVLESRIRLLVNLDEMQFGFMPGKGTTEALFLVRRMQEEYRDKGKPLYMHFVIWKRHSIMSLYEGAKTDQSWNRVVGRVLCESRCTSGINFISIVICYHMVDVITESAREGLMK